MLLWNTTLFLLVHGRRNLNILTFHNNSFYSRMDIFKDPRNFYQGFIDYKTYSTHAHPDKVSKSSKVLKKKQKNPNIFLIEKIYVSNYGIVFRELFGLCLVLVKSGELWICIIFYYFYLY